MAEPQAQGRRVASWALSTHIGAGSFAIVWRAHHVETGAEAAVKEINLAKLNAKLRQSLESEVSILKRIDHENIVKLHEVIEVRAPHGLRECWGGRCLVPLCSWRRAQAAAHYAVGSPGCARAAHHMLQGASQRGRQ